MHITDKNVVTATGTLLKNALVSRADSKYFAPKDCPD
jgi:hypothetical protein